MNKVILKEWVLNNVPSHLQQKFFNQLAKWDNYSETDQVLEYILVAQLQFVKS